MGKVCFLLEGLAALLAFAVLLLGAGCSHNAVTYGDGIMLETTVNPETWTFGISFRYGKILTVCVRENSEIIMHGGGAADAKTADASAKSASKVTIKIGPQITGYTVDAIKAGATPADLKR